VIISKSAAALAVVAVVTVSGVDTSRAGDGGAVAAGVLGGLAAGAIIGSATAPRPYYAPAPVYVAPPAPVYVAPPPPACYWTRGEPVWNGYAWVRPRVQVCE